MQILVEAGVDVNQVCNGMTPLDSAIQNGNQLTIEYLQHAGGVRMDTDGSAAEAAAEAERQLMRKNKPRAAIFRDAVIEVSDQERLEEKVEEGEMEVKVEERGAVGKDEL